MTFPLSWFYIRTWNNMRFHALLISYIYETGIDVVWSFDAWYSWQDNSVVVIFKKCQVGIYTPAKLYYTLTRKDVCKSVSDFVAGNAGDVVGELRCPADELSWKIFWEGWVFEWGMEGECGDRCNKMPYHILCLKVLSSMHLLDMRFDIIHWNGVFTISCCT